MITTDKDYRNDREIIADIRNTTNRYVDRLRELEEEIFHSPRHTVNKLKAGNKIEALICAAKDGFDTHFTNESYF